MNSIQEKVDELIKKYNLESSVEIRFIDLISELGELGKEILKGNEYGKKVFCNTENVNVNREMYKILNLFMYKIVHY